MTLSRFTLWTQSQTGLEDGVESARPEHIEVEKTEKYISNIHE